MARFNEEFKVRSIVETPYYNIKVETDNTVFIDPSIIMARRHFDEMCRICHLKISSFFQTIIELLRKGNDTKAEELVNRLSEPNETRFGYSRNKPQGKGVSGIQGIAVLNALKVSRAMNKGLITDLHDCELFIKGMNHDKVSDMVTNIIMMELAIFTRTQCKLLGIPTYKHSFHCWDDQRKDWIWIDASLPEYAGEPIILVPACFVARNPEYDYKKFYNREILDYLLISDDARKKLEITLQAPINKERLKSVCPVTKDLILKVVEMKPELVDKLKQRIEDGVLSQDDKDIIPIKWDIGMLD